MMGKFSDDDALPSVEDILGPTFEHILDAIPRGLLIVDPQGKLAVVNRAAERLFLLSRTEWKGLGLEALVPDAPKSEQPLCRLRAVRKDGTEFQVEFVLSPLPTREGGWWIVSSAEPPREMQLESDGREETGQFKAYWEAASEGLITVDASGTSKPSTTRSSAFLAMFGPSFWGGLDIFIPESLRGTHAEKVKQFLADPSCDPWGSG